MNFLLSSELQEFSKILKDFFPREVPTEIVRKQIDEHSSATLKSAALKNEHQTKLWTKFQDLGLLAAPISEVYQGLGFLTTAAAIIIEEAAKVLAPTPLTETIALATLPIEILGTTEKKETFLPKIAAGELRLSGAFQSCFSPNVLSLLGSKMTLPSWENSSFAASQKTADSYHLSGNLDLIPALDSIDGLLLPARLAPSTAAESLALFYLPRESWQSNPATAIEKQVTLDLTRNYYKFSFKQIPATLISSESPSAAHWSSVLGQILTLISAELVGVGSRVLQMSTDYAKTRLQFGKSLGSFQAVSHQLADMLLYEESSRALVRLASWAADHDQTAFPKLALSAKTYCSEFIPQLIQMGLQVHGGIGFTYEYDLHLYLRRARTLAALYGAKENLQHLLAQNEVQTI